MKIRYFTIISLVIGAGVFFTINSVKKSDLLQTKTQNNKSNNKLTKASQTFQEKSVSKTIETEKKFDYATQSGEWPRPGIATSFKLIQSKVFKTEVEQTNLKNMITDSAYIFELSNYLKSKESVGNDNFRINQNIAIDFLIEALKNGDANSAKQAIIEVIKDPQVEDNKLDQSMRETLAGVKAELLYQSSSAQPNLNVEIEKILPGPVSQKIWKNVLLQQNQNIADSELDRQKYIAQKHQ